MNRRRLYRSTQDRRLAGVAGGLADYLDVDPTLVRILWVVSVFFGGFTILLYIAMALIVPEGTWGPNGSPWTPPADPAWNQPQGNAPWNQPGAGQPGSGQPGSGAWWSAAAPAPQPVRHERRERGLFVPFVGLLLILGGSLALAQEFVPGLDRHVVWPAFLLGTGVLLVLAAMRRDTPDTEPVAGAYAPSGYGAAAPSAPSPAAAQSTPVTAARPLDVTTPAPVADVPEQPAP